MSIPCRECGQTGVVLADVLVAMEGGHPRYELLPKWCKKCQGHGVLYGPPRVYRGTCPVSYPVGALGMR